MGVEAGERRLPQPETRRSIDSIVGTTRRCDAQVPYWRQSSSDSEKRMAHLLPREGPTSGLRPFHRHAPYHIAPHDSSGPQGRALRRQGQPVSGSTPILRRSAFPSSVQAENPQVTATV